jgi:FlaA1/EpsC-like NDP-sugar epimerase
MGVEQLGALKGGVLARSGARHAERALTTMFGGPVRSRRRIRMVTDCAMWAIALCAGVLVRLDFDPGRLRDPKFLLLIPVAWIAQLGFGWWCGLYRGWWALGSFEEVPALGAAVGLTTTVLVAVDLVAPGSRPAPLGSLLAAGLIAFVAMGAVRHLSRRFIDQRRRARAGDGRPPAIVFGAGQGGELAVRSLLYDAGSPYRPVAVLDDDPGKRNLSVRGIRVVGDRYALAEVAARTKATTLVIAVPTGDGALIRELSESARAAGLDVRVVPSMGELLGGRARIRDLRAPTEADLLGRHTIETDLDSVSEYLRGKRVVVTGAGGSIGAELCRQISAFEPERLVMIDRDESGLHAVQLSIEGRALLDSDDLLLLDIRDRARLMATMCDIKPDVVFHAAALKHLPLLQAHPAEAIKTNVWGTAAVLDAAALAGVSRFVNISTDKAADPSSALGCSKRIAEGLTAHYGCEHAGTYLSVRFGNVLGSRGSVLTAFRSQLEAGEALTVTDPEVTRYFMTIEEAVQLVVQAGAIGSDGQVLVLDMGEPVRIADVARQLASTREPEVPIVFTGLRPGEKLHEQLFCLRESPRPSAHPLIREVDVPPLDPAHVTELDTRGSREELLETMRQLVESIDHRLGPDVDLVAEEALEREAAY